MSDEIKNNPQPNDDEVLVYPLTDEETGEEKNFALLAEGEIDGRTYYAMIPADEEDAEEYVILRVSEDGEDLLLESIEDDDEFDKAEDYFNDLFFSEIDYDEK